MTNLPKSVTYSNLGLNLEKFVSFEKEKTTENRVLYHGIHFNLTDEIIAEVEQYRAIGDRLSIPRSLLTDLRYYTLLDGENRLQSGLTFLTHYQQANHLETILRSVISPDGDIIHQIKNDYLNHPKLLLIASTHYWLVSQLLLSLRLKITYYLNTVAWGIALITIISPTLRYINNLSKLNPWQILLSLILLLPWQWVLKQYIIPLFFRWLLRQTLRFLLSPTAWQRNLAKMILGRMMP